MNRENNKCNGLVLNCSLNNFSISAFLEFMTEYLNELGFPPNYLGITGESYSGSFKTIKSGTSQLEKKGYKGVESLTLVHTANKGDAPAYDWLAMVMVNLSGNDAEIFIGCPTSYFSYSVVKKLINNIASWFIIDYGYVFTRKFNLGPEFYGSGIIQGDISKEEELSMVNWMKEIIGPKRYKLGNIRDVFEINVVTSTHLSNELISGITFSEFIRDNPQTMLESVTNDVFLWVVPKELINSLKLSLSDQTILVASYTEE